MYTTDCLNYFFFFFFRIRFFWSRPRSLRKLFGKLQLEIKMLTPSWKPILLTIRLSNTKVIFKKETPCITIGRILSDHTQIDGFCFPCARRRTVKTLSKRDVTVISPAGTSTVKKKIYIYYLTCLTNYIVVITYARVTHCIDIKQKIYTYLSE